MELSCGQKRGWCGSQGIGIGTAQANLTFLALSKNVQKRDSKCAMLCVRTL